MSAEPARMDLPEAVLALHRARRGDEVVVSTMGVAREWMKLAPHPLDFVFVPSSMGQAPALGLGLALARPERRVIVLNGDGSTLMNLGSLVTITAERPRNLSLVVFDNGVYEVTGAQPTPGSAEGRSAGDRVDFEALARASGFRTVHRFSRIERWRSELRAALDAEGPAFILLELAPVPGARGPRSPGPADERARRFMETLERVGSKGAP